VAQEQEDERKRLDSLSEEEKSELDKSLGPKVGPKPLSAKEQQKIEEMALEGEKPEAKPVRPAPAPAPVPTPKPKPESKPAPPPAPKPVPKKAPAPATGPKPWLPKPVRPAPTQADNKPIPAGEKEVVVGKSRLTILGKIGYGLLILIVAVIILAGLSYVDAKGWLPLGINRVCQNFGLSEGCLSFLIGKSASPSKEVATIRQRFQATTSHKFEVEFKISLPVRESEDQAKAAEGGQLLTLNGRVAGVSRSNDCRAEATLEDQSSQNQLWQDLVSKPIKVRFGDQLFLKSEALASGSWLKVAEADLLSYFDFLTISSGGIDNIQREKAGSGLTKYILTFNSPELDLGDWGKATAIEITIYASDQEKLPQEVDLKIQLAKGVIEIAKHYTAYNSVEAEPAEKITAERQFTLKQLASLIQARQLTVQERDKQRKEDLSQIQAALEAYHQARGRYPVSEGFDKIDRAESVVAQALVPDYLSAMPYDPLADRNYYGYQSVSGSKYTLTCIAENRRDPQAKKAGDIYLYYLRSH